MVRTFVRNSSISDLRDSNVIFFNQAEKYCRLLKDENGFILLETLICRTNHPKVRHFAKIALEGSVEYLERSARMGDDHPDELEG